MESCRKKLALPIGLGLFGQHTAPRSSNPIKDRVGDGWLIEVEEDPLFTVWREMVLFNMPDLMLDLMLVREIISEALVPGSTDRPATDPDWTLDNAPTIG